MTLHCGVDGGSGPSLTPLVDSLRNLNNEFSNNSKYYVPEIFPEELGAQQSQPWQHHTHPFDNGRGEDTCGVASSSELERRAETLMRRCREVLATEPSVRRYGGATPHCSTNHDRRLAMAQAGACAGDCAQREGSKKHKRIKSPNAKRKLTSRRVKADTLTASTQTEERTQTEALEHDERLLDDEMYSMLFKRVAYFAEQIRRVDELLADTLEDE